MRFLVLGCNGMAGHMISLYLKEQNHAVVGFARTPSGLVESVVGDAEDRALVAATIRNGAFDAVVNCIGLLNQFAENNKAKAAYLNACFPHLLAEITEHTNTQVIHISTDCVFSGKAGRYTEDAFPDGRSFYDRSKALGELDDEKNLTLRQSIIGPDIKPSGIGLMNWFMQRDISETVNGYAKTMWTGQTTLQLAKTVEAAAKDRIHGIYNMVPDQKISKNDLLRLMNRYLRNNALHICAVDGPELDKSLQRTRFDFSYRIPDYETMMAELAQWMRAHKELYAHYHLI